MPRSGEIVSGHSENMFDNAAIVAAHPDDEILWFSSVIDHVSRLILAYLVNRNPKVTSGRQRIIAEHPKTNLVSLGLTEAGTFALIGRRAKPTPYGIQLSDRKVDACYRSNYDQLLKRLRPFLAICGDVYTHNPWGEYGHPDHVQVYRSVCHLQREFGFRLWFPNYVSRRAHRLRMRLAPSTRVAKRAVLSTNLSIARQLEKLYVQHQCWTWYSSYRWPDTEEFLCQELGSPESLLASQYLPIHLNERLTLIDRLKWEKAAMRRKFEHSLIGRFLPGPHKEAIEGRGL
jgi:LmbE family N-acetylglucosaminyl deacetylase